MTSRHKTVWAGVCVLALTAIGGITAWLTIPSGGRADPGNPTQVALGKTVYAQHCASCHGANLEGQPNWRDPKPDGRFPAPPHDASGHTWHHPQDMLFGITKQGIQAFAPEYKSDMPAFDGTLTDEEIWAVLAFIASSWPEDTQARWMAISQQPKEQP